MDLDYSLEDYDTQVREAYLRLLPHQERAVGAGKLDWKFARNPAGKGRIVVCRSGGQIVGLNAFMAGAFGGGFASYQSMDTIVAPEARGQGVFSKLVSQFYTETDGDVLYGFPNQSSSPGFFGRLGWQSLGPAPMLVKPLRTGLFLKRISRLFPDFALPSLLPTNADISPITRFGSEVARVWDGFSQRGAVQFALRRDSGFLNWRLFDHPLADYKAWTFEQSAFAASCIEEKHGGRIGYIMDAFGDDAGVGHLVTGITREMCKSKADAVFAWVLPHSPNYRAFRNAGFLPLPNRIRPIKLNLGARALHADGVAPGNVRDWYVSYLDSDTV